MTLTAPTTASLASFMGVQSSDLNPYSSEALSQATDLMQIALDPEVTENPTDAFQLRIFTRGICAMAEAIIVAKPTRASAALPFRTETIGSYTYEKWARAVTSSEATGIPWFDATVSLLLGGVLDDEMIPSGASIFERDISAKDTLGRPYVFGPADVDLWPDWPRQSV